MKNLLRPCPICNNLSGEILHKQLFFLPSNSPLPEDFEIVYCLRCGFVFADTRANQTVYNYYYTLLSKYEDMKISSGSGIGNYDYHRLELTALSIKRVLPDLSANILDMGCANGGLLKSLKKLGYLNIMGIDPSRSCNNQVNDSGIPCMLGDIFSDSFQKMTKSFDCIILTHVLEHIYDLKTAIENLSLKLVENGILYIEVPDASRYSDYFIVPYYYIDCEHINHFDNISLSNLLVSGGFKLIESRSIEFEVNLTHNYPAVYSIFTKSSVLNGCDYTRSDISKNSFLKFIEQSRFNTENDIIIEKLVETQEPIVVWGAGQFTLRLLANSCLCKCNLQYFVDSDANKQGKLLAGYPIEAPEILYQSTYNILICSALHSNNIFSLIREMGMKNLVYIMK